MVAQFYPPIIGGEESHVSDLSQALARRGHKVSVATIGVKGATPMADGNTVIYEIPTLAQNADSLFGHFTTNRPFAPPIPDPLASQKLKRIIEVENPDVIHGHNWLARSLIPPSVRRGHPFIVTLHDYSLICATKRFVHKGETCSGPSVGKCLACAANHYGVIKGTITTTGQWVGSYLERHLVDMYIAVSQSVVKINGLETRNLPFRIIPNFLADTIAETTSELSLQARSQLPDRPYILFVGDLSYDKGLYVLLEAYSRLSDSPPLVLIGRGPNSFDAFSPNITVINELRRQDVIGAWSSALFGVCPSIVQDTSPLVIKEAMAQGRAVIGTRSGGIPDMIDDGFTGLLVSPRSVDELATSMAHLLKTPHLCQTMGTAAKKKLEAFREAAIVPKIEDLYEYVITNRTNNGHNQT